MIERGSIGWVEAGDPKDRFPVVVVQSDPFNQSKIPTVLVVPLASGTRLADAPGNVLVPASASGLPRETVAKFKEARVDDPAAHFKGKTILVTGKVTLYQERPQIRVEDPKQIQVVEKKDDKGTAK